jgi:hypothetical protein
LKFPNARHDDFVDALAWLGMSIDRMASPQKQRVKEDGIVYGTLGWLKSEAKHREQTQALEAAIKGW